MLVVFWNVLKCFFEVFWRVGCVLECFEMFF